MADPSADDVPAPKTTRFPGFAGAALRTIDIGIKGMVMSLYYANLTGADYRGRKVFDIIGWTAKLIMPHDEPLNGSRPAEMNYHQPDASDVEKIVARARQVQPEIASRGR
jgi:hypothetical protein